MQNAVMWWIVLGFVLILVTRSLPRIINPAPFGGDIAVHLQIIEAIRENNHAPMSRNEQSLLGSRFSYPVLVHQMMSYLPPRVYPLADRLFSPMVDIGLAVALLLVIPLELATTEGVAIMILLFAATPNFVRPDRAGGAGFSARKPGHLLVVLTLLLVLAALATTSLTLALIAVFPAALVLLTSKFATQSLVVTILAMAMFVQPTIIGALLLSFPLAILLSKKYYLSISREHLWFIYEYARSKQYKFLYDGWKALATLRGLVAAMRTRSLNRALRTLFESILLRAPFDVPLVVPALIAVVLVPASSIPQGVMVWFLAMVSMTVLTSIYHLRFLGSAERYLGYAVVPGSIMIVHGLDHIGSWYRLTVILSVGLGLLTCGIYAALAGRWRTADWQTEVDTLTRYLRTLPPSTILVQPRGDGARIAWKTSHSVNDYLGNGNISQSDLRFRNRLFPEREGWVTDDIAWLDEAVEPDLLVFNRSKLEGSPSNALREPGGEPIWESTEFAIYPFESAR